MQKRISLFILCFIIVYKISNAEDFYQHSQNSVLKCPYDPTYEECKARKNNYFENLIETTTIQTAPDSSSHCTRLYILDLSKQFMSKNDFNVDVKFFLTDSINNCMKNGIGDLIRIGVYDQIQNLDNYNYTGFYECTTLNECYNIINNFNYDDMIVDYGNETDLYITDTTFTNSYSNDLSIILKSITCPCKLNSAVLLTNRIVNVTSDPQTNYTSIFDFSCTEFSIILLGRNDSTSNYDQTLQLLSQTYGIIKDSLNHGSTVFNAPNYNCLGNITTCIPPCNTTTCAGVRLDNCPAIITTTTTTTTTTPPPPTVTTSSTAITPPETEIPGTRHILYVLAFSNKFTQTNLTTVLDNLIKPLEDLEEQQHLYVPRFKIIITSTTSSIWYYSPDTFKTFVDTITIDQTKINADTIDSSDTETIHRLDLARTESPLIQGIQGPIVILLTDFYATKFGDSYSQPDEPLKSYYLRVYVFNTEAYQYYKAINNTSFELFLHVNVNDTVPLLPTGTTISPTNPIPKKDDKISEVTVVIIIFGAIGGAIAILCTCSFLYKQRMSWKTKLENIRANHHKHDEEGGDVRIDYWELTWDKLLVKSEKLGSGAFGQVLRGKIIGKPPCYENFYENLQIRNLTQMENTDVAIKMLPKYADDAAKKEFMNEIELMKLIGYHDNIVNMLGCVTVGHPMCLVLEFCPYRDLLQYVKGRKVEVSISKSLEEKINHTKDFLIFAWQIAQGMKFLASKSIIHRDLAARNVLIDADKNAKISDFGLCVQTTDKSINSPTNNNVLISASGRLPIKWLAIESLKNHEFSLKSDIWAFGIVLYEMYSLGEIPFAKIEPKMLLDHLEAGNRPEKPEFCNQETYDIMLNCWHESPPQRPTFEELLTIFTVFLERSTEGYGYLPLLKSETTANLNGMSPQLAQNTVPAAEPPVPKKTVRQRLTSETNRIIKRLKRTNTKNSVFQIEDEDGDNDEEGDDNMKPLKIQIPAVLSAGPPYSAGVEQIRPRFTSVRSAESYGSLNDIDAIESMDPGVEMRNGKPRLKSNLIASSTNSSLRKSSTFNLGDTPKDGDLKKSPFFQRFL